MSTNSSHFFRALPIDIVTYTFSLVPWKSLPPLRQVDKATKKLYEDNIAQILNLQTPETSLTWEKIEKYKNILKFKLEPHETIISPIAQIFSKTLIELHLLGEEVDIYPPALNEILKQASNLQSLKISYHPKHIEMINTEAATKLSSLFLVNQNQQALITDEVVNKLISAHPSLSNMNLLGYFDLTDESISLFCSLQNLESLSINGAALTLGDKGLEKLASKAHQLTQLTLGLSAPRSLWQLSDQGLQHFGLLTRLTDLTLYSGPQQIVNYLSGCTRLSHLELIGCGLNNPEIQNLFSLVNLKKLNISENWHPTNDGLGSLSSLQNLTELTIDDEQFSETTLENLKNQIQNLKISVLPIHNDEDDGDNF